MPIDNLQIHRYNVVVTLVSGKCIEIMLTTVYKMFQLLLIALFSSTISADDESKCRVKVEVWNTKIYCHNLILNDTELTLDVQPIQNLNLYLNLVNCTGKIDETSFSNLRELTSIYMERTNLEEFTLPTLPKLTNIEIANSELPGLNDTFKNIKELQSLSLKGNSFEIADNSLDGLDRLESLSIYKQNISLNERLLKDLKKLRSLNIYEGSIEEIGSGVFKHTPDLISVAVHDNHLTTIKKGALDPLEKLETFEITSSKLKTFEASLTNELQNLRLISIPASTLDQFNLVKLLYNCPYFHIFRFYVKDQEDCGKIKKIREEISRLRVNIAIYIDSSDHKAC